MNSLVRVKNLCGLNEKSTKRNFGRNSQGEYLGFFIYL